MDEIKKCPLCGRNAYAEVTVCFGSVKSVLGCTSCKLECEKMAKLEDGDDVIQAMNKTFKSALNTWNKRAEEPQERKESNVEWALKKIEKGDFYFSICEIANYIKNGKPCAECDECEFQDDEDAINYLLAPHEKGNK